MSSAIHINHPVNHLKRPMKWLLLCALFCFARAAVATVPLFQNDQVLNYTCPPQPIPTIDATNFVNNNSFTINFEALTVNTELFEPENTVNYTNNSTMAVNTGFEFDTLTSSDFTPHVMAGNFYNGGSISCASILNTNIALFVGAGELIVSATNIANPGTIDVGEDGLISLSGQNVDLTRSTITMEGLQTALLGTVGMSVLDYGIGKDTNYEWEPSIDLGPTFALSSLFSSTLFPAPGFTDLYLPSSSSYFQQPFEKHGTNYVIVRAVFLNTDPGSGISQNVFFGGSVVGNGAAHIEWSGTYLDPSTGLMRTNYLYLSDYYVGGANTNNLSLSGVPANFTFDETSARSPDLVTPTPPGYLYGVLAPAGVVTNTYSYVDAQLIATTVPTNSPSPNVTNYLAILPGRLQIAASKGLNMSLAEVSGMNYLSLQANQFNGSGGAQIFSPYSDINIGVTNGNMTVTNLLEPALPNWSGTLQAWSSDWMFVDTNGVTNDFRVILVNANLQPTTPSQVGNLAFHATNSVTISDTFNVLGTLSIDSQNLTLTTNSPGSPSPVGELNLESGGILFASALPNLKNLTNYGIINNANSAFFGGASPGNYKSLINFGTISDQGSSIWADDFENYGSFASGIGPFALQSATATLAGGSVTAGGNISITSGSLVMSNLVLQSAGSLTLAVTTNLTDTGVTNGNIWSVGGGVLVGLNLSVKPKTGDLLGTTIAVSAPGQNENLVNTWAGVDYGASTAGYTNNVAVGRLILDSLTPPPHTQFTFNGAGVSNAIYVDELILTDQATNFDSGHNLTALNINNNLVIYYAQALINGSSIAEKLNHKNNNQLRWVPSYAGYFSSTNIVYPDGSTNTFNAALAQSQNLDSDGDGIVNGSDPTPFLIPSEMNFTVGLTNVQPKVRLSWQTIPNGGTNYVFYKTSLAATNWQVLTNFTGGAGGQATVFDTLSQTNSRFYRVRVDAPLP